VNEEPRHLWITGATRAVRSGPLLEQRPDVAVDCHRRRFGPYTGVGSLLRALLPGLGDWAAAAAARHRKEVLAVAPELAGLLGTVQGNLTVTVPELERTRWFPASTTRRQGQGLSDLLRVLPAPDGPGRPLTLALDSVHEADPTDLEFLTLALRRLDPARVRLVVGGAAADWPQELVAARELHTRQLPAAGPGPAGYPPLVPLASNSSTSPRTVAGAAENSAVPSSATNASVGRVPCSPCVPARSFSEPYPTPRSRATRYAPSSCASSVAALHSSGGMGDRFTRVHRHRSIRRRS